jgi:hypothetical protein
MTATQDSHDEVPAPEPAPELEAGPGPGEDAYSASDEEEIAARLEALGYLE